MTTREALAAGIPPRFLRHSLSTFRPIPQQIHDFFAQKDCWSLYIWGPTGSRKTTLAAAMLVEIRRHHPPGNFGLFLPAYLVVSVLRDSRQDFGREHIERWVKDPAIILDDLGKHRDTPHVWEQLLFLLHKRYDWAGPGHKTILTANISLDKLAKRIDPATARRLEEGMVLHTKAPSSGNGRR